MKYSIEASVLGKPFKDRFRLKVSIYDLGLYIMGMIVQNSIIEGESYYVTTPAHKVGNKFYKDITFEASHELWQQIQAACIKSVDQYKKGVVITRQ